MHGLRHRQLRAALFTGLFALTSHLTASPLPPSPAQQAANELQAARLLETALQARGASEEDRQKLDRVYAELIVKFPGDVAIKNSYAAFLWECQEHGRAETVWKDAEKLAPENSATQHGLATVALAAGDVRKAAERMRRACAAEPENAMYHFDLANVLFMFRREFRDSSAEASIDRALKHYSEACRLAPLNIDYARGYAESFYGLSKPDWNGALAAWQHLLEISPRKDFALANLATIHLKLGRKDEARACVEKMQDPAFAGRKARLIERIKRE